MGAQPLRQRGEVVRLGPRALSVEQLLADQLGAQRHRGGSYLVSGI